MNRGFTLLEVVVSLVLLQVAVVGAVGTLAVASRNLAEAEILERAVLGAEGVLDSLRGMASATDGSRPADSGGLEWSVDSLGGVSLYAAHPDGSVLFEVRAAVRP